MEGEIDRDLCSKIEMDLKIEEDDEEYEEEDEEEEEFSFMFGGEDIPEIAAAEDVFVNGQIKPTFPFFTRSSAEGSDSPAVNPPVSKVFVETEEDEIEGPYCEWSNRKAVEISRERCKKSNSTGFSKIRRIKEFISRSNSDGRDAFVFLNHGGASKESTAAPIKKKKKTKTTPYSAHEVYLRNKAKEEQRRRYKPELIGIFTNVNVGLTRNVHPF